MNKTYEVKFSIDDLKALKIAGRLFSQFYNRQGFFTNYLMPEYVLPRNLKEGSREHTLFLTYVISIDYMTDAVKLWKRSRGAYGLHAERFDRSEMEILVNVMPDEAHDQPIRLAICSCFFSLQDRR